ncbi:MAG: asparagine synthetase B [Candidatus Eiseniibacteriota bacterium]|nr:MAG: asparagine synthetase B [Candidatus Eisenbacteria bacterium]
MLLVAAAVLLVSLAVVRPASAELLVNMDLKQRDHLRAYGLAYWCLEQGTRVDWLLNYRGGSFLVHGSEDVATKANLMGVSFEVVSGADVAVIHGEIEENNMEIIVLEKAPKIAVYIPPTALPWDDAVTLALEYAQIPYTKVWDEEILAGALDEFDWLHLHHEDFTGQYGKFYGAYRNAVWYKAQQTRYEEAAKRAGFVKVSQHKLAVVRKIKEYIARGGFMFAMCSATDTFDIALAADGIDFLWEPYDGDPPEPDAEKRLDFSKTLAFENFYLTMNPLVYEFSDLDVSEAALPRGPNSHFVLFEFSAKHDPVPTMLTQNHAAAIPDFMGQTTGFKAEKVKSSVAVLAEVTGVGEVKYVHGNYGRGTFTFYGGHDPEDFRHNVGDPPTDLSLHKNSPGYRLILNNILFPAAEKKKQKT